MESDSSLCRGLCWAILYYSTVALGWVRIQYLFQNQPFHSAAWFTASNNIHFFFDFDRFIGHIPAKLPAITGVAKPQKRCNCFVSLSKQSINQPFSFILLEKPVATPKNCICMHGSGGPCLQRTLQQKFLWGTLLTDLKIVTIWTFGSSLGSCTSSYRYIYSILYLPAVFTERTMIGVRIVQ